MDRRHRTLAILAVLLLTTSALAGCMGEDPAPGDGTDGTDGTGDGGDQQQAAMTTYMKDAPTDEFDEIWLNVSSVEVHFAGAAGNDTAYDGDEEGNGTDGAWITVVNETRSLNLLAFQEEGAKAFLGEELVEPGRYTQIRLHVTEAWGVQGAENVTIRVASGTAKVVRSFMVPANGSTTQVVIDLDLDRSLKRTGPPGGGGPGAGDGSPGDGARDQDGGNRTGDRGGGGDRGQAPQGQQASWILTPVIGKVLVDHVSEGPRRDLPDQEPGAPNATEGTGNASAYLAGSPLDGWGSFHVNVTGFEVRTADGNATWAGFLEEARSVDLLNFTGNGSMAFLGGEEVPAGGYDAVRVTVGDAWGVRNGTRTNVTLDNTTVMSSTNLTVSAGNDTTTQIVVDLDVETGLEGNATAGWSWSPVIEDVSVDHVMATAGGDQPDTA